MNFVKNVIDNWDPIDLLSHAPDDEYRPEVERIQHLLMEIRDPYKLADAIYNVFVEAFGNETFNKSKEECTQIAKALISQNDDQEL